MKIKLLKVLFRYLYRISISLQIRSFLLSEYLRSQEGNREFRKGFFMKILLKPQEYEDPINLLRFLKTDEKILLIDVGANTGKWAEKIIYFFKNTHIMAFEPDKRSAKYYESLFSEKGKCQLYECGLSNTKGTAEMTLTKDTLFSTLESYSENIKSEKMDAIKKQSININKLDNFKINEQNFDKVFLKIDVQGHEIEVLEGAKNTLKKCDVVLLELSFFEEFEGKTPSFSKAVGYLQLADLYPVHFQNYGTNLSPYAWERDVIFVKKDLLKEIWGW